MTPAALVAAHAGLARSVAARAAKRWPTLDRDDALSLAFEMVWKATGSHPEGTPAMAWDGSKGRPFAWWAARLAWRRVRTEVWNAAQAADSRRRATVHLSPSCWREIRDDYRLAAAEGLTAPCVMCGDTGGVVKSGRKLPYRCHGRCWRCHYANLRGTVPCSYSVGARANGSRSGTGRAT